MTTPKTKLSLMLGTIGIAVALSGCSASEADEARGESSPSEPAETAEYVAASAEGPAENVPAPVVPDAVKEHSADGARATIEYFWEAVDYGRLTGNTEPIEQVTHYVCESCNQLIYKWEQIYEDGAWAVLDGETSIKIGEVQQNYTEETDEEWTAVLFKMDEPSSEFYQDGVLNEDASTEGGESAGWWVEMVYDEDDGQWVIDWLDIDPAFDE
ncbi:DUF6318 family protein [Enteractinococcus coprophilus]|uniref:DUF6318 domain-containing protein n=1 Tax=Enteractinococcus coprophilus TaxID=1027633 RepID=A0A543API5_9MICC|nr:DUF6318 family protein [Enteractinococcus coprophilus]TQL74469.1 hypothetical protein FB556_0934 [Enteractinococcus coprophilus]